MTEQKRIKIGKNHFDGTIYGYVCPQCNTVVPATESWVYSERNMTQYHYACLKEKMTPQQWFDRITTSETVSHYKEEGKC